MTVVNCYTLILGHTWAHNCCAAWSDDVTQDEDGALKFVDKAVLSGLSKVRKVSSYVFMTVCCKR